MNFVVSSKTLLQQLQIVNGTIASNSNVPILNDFLFEADDKGLTVYGSDLETTIAARITDITVKSAGRICIPAKILMETLKSFTDIPLTFTVDNKTNGVVVSSETGKYKQAGHNADEYPKMPELAKFSTVNIESMTLAHAVNKTIFATGNDDLRPVMSGILFEMGSDGSNFVATDAHKLVKYHRKDVKAEGIASIILPKKPLSLLKNILATIDVPVTVEYSDANIRFKFENITVVSRLVEGKYPNYEAVIPKSNPNKLTVDKAPLLSSLRRVSNFSNKTTYQVRLKLSSNEMQLSAEDLDFANEAYEKLPCSYEGDEMEIGFNSKFLMEMISNIDGETVTFQLSEPNRAGIIRPSEMDTEVEDVTMLVMPIMLGN
jgi:DNA polymerase-3 subunit beta